MSRRSIWTIAVALALGAILPFGLHAQQRGHTAAAPMTLTALDYVEIQQLVAKYARAIDTCSNNGYDYADLFTADGYFAPFQNGTIGTKFQGRERLAEAYKKTRRDGGSLRASIT